MERSEFVVDEGLQRLLQWGEIMLPVLESEHGGMVVPAGRKLARDSRESHPALISTFVVSDLLVAAEHIETLRAMIAGGLVMPRAPFTLLRAAVEGATASLWLLSPTSRRVRARRAVLRAEASGRAETHLERALGTERDHTRRRIAMDAAMARIGIEEKRVTEALKETRTTTMLSAIADINVGDYREAMWRLCSGLAHGEIYATVLLSKPIDESEENGVWSAKLEAHEGLIEMFASLIGLDLSRVLVMARDAGATWPNHEETVSAAIALFPNREVREAIERRGLQFTRQRR